MWWWSVAISSGCFCGGETGDDRTNEAKHTVERSGIHSKQAALTTAVPSFNLFHQHNLLAFNYGKYSEPSKAPATAT
jgi:hypothetical protein